MSRTGMLVMQACLVVFLAAGTAAGVVLFLGRRMPPPPPAQPTAPARVVERDLHEWMHQNLQLTRAQHERLHPIEQQFEEREEELRQEILEAGKFLAAAIQEDSPGSERIDTALVRLNQAQGELQRVTIDHFFAMKEHLNPQQAKLLLRWTHDSILHGYGE